MSLVSDYSYVHKAFVSETHACMMCTSIVVDHKGGGIHFGSRAYDISFFSCVQYKIMNLYKPLALNC